MGLLDALFTNGDLSAKGFNAILEKQYYVIAYDKNHNIVCWFYDMDGIGAQLIEKYYEHNDLNKDEMHTHKKMLKNKSEEVINMTHKKICILDKKLVTFEIVENLAKSKNIKGYKEGKLKRTLNKFEIINEE